MCWGVRRGDDVQPHTHPAPPCRTRAPRHKQLAQLLDASEADMQRIAGVYPNMLARDTGALRANLQSLKALLGVDDHAVRALVRREPGLMSHNMASLAARWTWAMQVGARGGGTRRLHWRGDS